MKKIALFLCLLMAISGAAHAEAALPQSREQITLSFAPLVKKITPAVVNIYTQKLVRQRVSPLFGDPFFRQFFGDALPRGMTRERLEHSLGSGVIVRSDGLVVTSRHVIAGADQIRVVLSDRKEYDASVVLSDEHSDLAVLRVDSKGEAFPFLELKDSDEAEVGDLVLAVGNPFGVGQTVTSGIVSALTHKAVGAGDLGAFIQTDAAINPGNSGGALVTMDGKLIGINATIFSKDGGNLGIGFAVPSNMARLLIDAVEKGKSRLTYPWVGIDGQDVSPKIALSLGLVQPEGVLVKGLHPASPALKAGLKTGDVVVSVDGKGVENPDAFRYRLAGQPIGSSAEFGVLRGGQKIALRVAMVEPPEDPPRNETEIEGRAPLSGASIANLSPAVATDMGLPDTRRGVVVTKVGEGTMAARVGLSAGDIVAAINGEEIADVNQAARLLKEGAARWKLKIQRGSNDITLILGGS